LRIEASGDRKGVTLPFHSLSERAAHAVPERLQVGIIQSRAVI
jgi:hypothetical protein